MTSPDRERPSLAPAEAARIVDVALDIAKEAGAILRAGWGARPSYRTKATAIDLVTEYDERSEALIVERLHSAFPEHGIVGEEGARIEGQGATKENAPVWYIDPLDGTANFAHGVPQFSVSMGLAIGAAPVVGVVYAPAQGWMFHGGPGVGAFLNGEPVRVSDVQDVQQSMLGTGFPSKRGPEQDNFPEFMALTGKVHGTRRFGSAALDLAFVACGWFDAFWERHISPWDLTGGAAIVLGAGGRVTDLDGGRYDGRTGRCLASNGHIHDELSDILEGVARDTARPWP